MKIAIEGYELNRSYTGVGRYLYNLLKEILKIDKVNNYILYLVEELPFKLEAPNLKIEILGPGAYSKWQNVTLYRALIKDEPDLLFCPNHSIPFFWRGNSMMTIHDVSWKVVKGDFSFKERFLRDIKTTISLKKALKVFTVSEFSKQETLKYYNTEDKKIVPILSSIEEGFRRSDQKSVDQFKKTYNIGNEFLIGFLGSIFPRRHLIELLQAHKIVKKHLPCKLILCGRNFCGETFDSLSHDPDVIRIERIEEEDINTFYSALDLFAYLSSYEGFGFPPMEALQCQTPSLLLEGSSLGEIYPDIALFCQTTNPDEIAGKIIKYMDNSEKTRETIFKNWKNKREYYSWSRTAAKYLQYFNNSASSPSN